MNDGRRIVDDWRIDFQFEARLFLMQIPVSKSPLYDVRGNGRTPKPGLSALCRRAAKVSEFMAEWATEALERPKASEAATFGGITRAHVLWACMMNRKGDWTLSDPTSQKLRSLVPEEEGLDGIRAKKERRSW